MLGLNKKERLFLLAAFLVGLYLRVHHIEFGLPHSFYADEPEIVELAVKYTYELRDIVGNNNWYKMIPISFVYGTFPTYVLTLATMFFSKSAGILGVTFEKMHIYVFLRSLNALFSLLIVSAGTLLYYKLFRDKFGTFLAAILLLFNWKLIVHAHYVNSDIVVTVLISLAYLFMYNYFTKKSDTKFTVLSGVCLGLAVGTKVTMLLTLPLFLYLFVKRRDYRGMFAFCFIIFSAFAITNPFSFIFAEDFAFRIYSMLFKEGGTVFDSVDSNPLKYIFGLGFISTLPIFLISLYGKLQKWKFSPEKSFHVFLIGHIVFYLIFYSLQSRRVDRWLLPVLPIVLMYGAYGISTLRQRLGKTVFLPFFGGILLYYLFFAGLLLVQFQRNTPKSASYIWMKEKLPVSANKLSYTEEGLDPVNKLPGTRVIKYQVYSSENAQFFLPENPEGYDYVILSSRPMQNHKRTEIKEKYPFYFEKWNKFEKQILDETKFKLIKKFELPKPNLIPLSNVFIYENLSFEKPDETYK